MMKELKTKRNGELTTKDIRFFGGQYSFWEKIKKKGIGSAKIIYESGIEEFDRLSRNITGEISFVNFELLKNGLILRLNINQRFCCLGVKLNEIEAINLISYRVAINVKRNGIMVTEIVHRGSLEIIALNDEIKFSVVVREFDSIISYFKKEEFVGKFNFSVSMNPVEKDYNILEEMIEYFR